jgi:hypothetical protein
MEEQNLNALLNLHAVFVVSLTKKWFFVFLNVKKINKRKLFLVKITTPL